MWEERRGGWKVAWALRGGGRGECNGVGGNNGESMCCNAVEINRTLMRGE